MTDRDYPFADLSESQLKVVREAEEKLGQSLNEDVILIAYEKETSGHNNIPTG